MRRLLISACFLFAAIGQAQPARVPAQYKRLLLPVHASTASWSVQWWFRNEGAVTVDAFPLAVQCGLTPPYPAAIVLPKPSLPAHITVNCPADDIQPSYGNSPYIPVISSAPGAFLYVERSAERVTIGGEVSRSRSSSAAALQAIPEEDFIAGTRSIMPVIVHPRRRYAIRIYALPESIAQSPRVRIRVWDMQPLSHDFPSEELAGTFDRELRVPVSSVRPCVNDCDIPDLPYVPAVAEVFDVVPPFQPKPFARVAARIEVIPESPSLRWWAVVSSTDNETHEITLYQPDR